jgi:hypothetical protein
MSIIPSRSPLAAPEDCCPIEPRDHTVPTLPAEQATLRVRRLLSGERDSALVVAERICRAITAVGRAEVDADLGDEAANLVTAYAALQTFIQALDPALVVPNLPD